MKTIAVWSIAFSVVLFTLNSRANSDSNQHNILSQDRCADLRSAPTYQPLWKAGLSQSIDNELLGGEIAAYQIRWFSGGWSGWYVPGVNDIDWKINPSDNTLRRVWSYFYDHEHRYILCYAENLE